jgi:hypothetical protein
LQAFFDFVTSNWKAIAAIIAAVVASGIVVRVQSNKQAGRTRVDQRGAKAGGDMVGRDKTVNRK